MPGSCRQLDLLFCTGPTGLDIVKINPNMLSVDENKSFTSYILSVVVTISDSSLRSPWDVMDVSVTISRHNSFWMSEKFL